MALRTLSIVPTVVYTALMGLAVGLAVATLLAALVILLVGPSRDLPGPQAQPASDAPLTWHIAATTDPPTP